MQHSFPLPEYSVFLGPLQETFPLWWQQGRYSSLCIIADDHTRQYCLPYFLQQTGLSPDTCIVAIAPGEVNKTLATCSGIWQSMLNARLDRHALVVNLGGGVIGDMGGFCAATYKRGIDFVQVPTTLLAMTDAAVGGKLGIDFQGIKNTIGVFRNPVAVFADPAFLRTLPANERRSGFAEMIKHALIGDPALWQEMQQMPGGYLQNADAGYWFGLLKASLAVKVRIVTEDPQEKDLRALLNFGHTIGHALESYFLNTPVPLTHGEAVAIGMICETPVDIPGLQQAVADMVLRHFGHRPVPEQDFPAIWELMLQDKKNAAGQVRMAVPGNEPFSLRWLEPTPQEVWQRLAGYNALA